MKAVVKGVRLPVKLGETVEELRGDRARAARLFALVMFEMACRTVRVGGREVSAWRIVGSWESIEHECLVEAAGERLSVLVF
jgi:hypothetical protein